MRLSCSMLHMMRPEILTLTINPALDIAATAPAVRPGHKIRTFDENYDPGGGGINVSRVVHELGGDTLALIASGGATGQLIEEMLLAANVPYKAVRIPGANRISFTVRDQASNLEYRFVPSGPHLTAADGDRIIDALSTIKASWIVASGSLPPGLESDFYAKVARQSAQCGARFAIDASGPALKAVLGQGIDLLKVSLAEFESIVGCEVRDLGAQSLQAQTCVRAGVARRIALTLGAQGALLATSDDVIHLPAVAVTEVNSVGAGDSFLAGMVLGLARGCSNPAALQLALAAAGAAVASVGTARVRRAAVEAHLPAGWHATNRDVLNKSSLS